MMSLWYTFSILQVIGVHRGGYISTKINIVNWLKLIWLLYATIQYEMNKAVVYATDILKIEHLRAECTRNLLNTTCFQLLYRRRRYHMRMYSLYNNDSNIIITT